MQDVTALRFAPRFLRGALAAAAVLLLSGGCDDEGFVAPVPLEDYDLVFESRDVETDETELWITTEDGSAVRLLELARQPAIYGTGQEIAFVRAGMGGGADIFISNRNTGALRALAAHTADDLMPAWSRDGARLAFVSNRAGQQDIWLVNSNGSGLVNLTPSDAQTAATSERWPTWSPDGARIAYASTVDGTYDIVTINATGTPIQRSIYVQEPDAELEPSWSPTGDRIAFRRLYYDSGESDIGILTVAGAGNGNIQIIRMPGTQRTPSWSPDGTLLAFSSNHEGGNFEIYTMEPTAPTATNVVRRTRNDRDDSRPVWVPRD